MTGHVVGAGILLAANTIAVLSAAQNPRNRHNPGRVKLSADGTGVSSDPLEYFRAADRYRDVAISPDGRRLFLVTDSFGLTLDASGQRTDILAHPGAVLEFSYVSAERKDQQP